MEGPSQKGHLTVSLIKSSIRIGAAVCLAGELFLSAGILFVIAELFGIAEEFA